MANVTLRIKEIDTAEVTIPIVIEPDIDGFVKATIFVRSKDEMKKLGENLEDGVYKDDVSLLKQMYKSIDGLGNEEGKPIEGEDVWTYLGGTSKLGSYLSNAFVQAYFGQYGEALQKNLKKRRSR